MTAAETFGKVSPDNRPRPARQRRDPDEDTPARGPSLAAVPPPAADPVATRPVPTQPGPTDPLPQPPGPAEPTGPTRATPGAVAARTETAGGGTLASVLTAPQTHNGSGHAPVSDGVAALMNLAALSDRPRDPMTDWVGDGTRTPKFLAESLRFYARLIGRPMQEVMRDCLLGTDAIPGDVLDATWMRMYGTRREDYDPQDYR